MAKIQLYKPPTPGASREKAEIVTATEAEIEARKKAGEDLSYEILEADAAAPPPPAPTPPAPPPPAPPVTEGGGGVGTVGGGGAAPASLNALTSAGPASSGEGFIYGTPSPLRQNMGRRLPPSLAFLLNQRPY